MLLQKLLSGGTGAFVVAERVALALLQADPRQILETVVLEERIEQRDGALHGPTIGSAVDDDVPAEGSAVAEIEPVVVRVPQQDPGLQQLQNTEGRQLTDSAVTRVRRQHGQPVKRPQELGPGGLGIARYVLHEIYIILINRFQLRYATGPDLAAAIYAAYISYMRQRTSVTVTNENQDAA